MATRVGTSRYNVDAETATADTAHLVNPDAVILAEPEAVYVAPRAAQVESNIVDTAIVAESGFESSKFDGILATTTGTYEVVNPNDFFVGTDNADTYNGYDGDDFLVGQGGNDWLIGGTGHDTLVGGTGHDRLEGESGVDWLIGDAGNDMLLGGSGNDTLNGGAGNDVLIGGTGVDVMTGGTGKDAFAVGNAEWNGSTWSAQKDIVTDFEVADGHDDVIGLQDALSHLTDFYVRNPTNASAQKAFSQGYIKAIQHGSPGDADYGTTIVVDSDGIYGHKGPDGVFTQGPTYQVADLLGVTATQLSVDPVYYGGNFAV